MKRALVIDNNEFYRKVLTDLLIEEGYDVAQAADGLAALQEAKNRRPDLVLLDLVMPKVDGTQVCRFFNVVEDKRYAQGCVRRPMQKPDVLTHAVVVNSEVVEAEWKNLAAGGVNHRDAQTHDVYGGPDLQSCFLRPAREDRTEQQGDTEQCTQPSVGHQVILVLGIGRVA